jgi:hypothetical protein
MARGKKVLHLGCADHVELIVNKRKLGTYLHDALEKSASLLWGGDVNTNALEKMSELGIKNLSHISDIPSTLNFDLVLAPDVIEHVGDVASFIRSLSQWSCPIIITTPNAYRLSNRMQLNSELVNTDHKYWFSPYTLAKSIYDAGFRITEYHYTDQLSWRSPLKSFVKWRYPLTRDGLLFVISSGHNSYPEEKQHIQNS